MSRTWLKLISILIIVLTSSVICQEETCSRDPNNTNQKSCGDEKYPELEINDENKPSDAAPESDQENSKNEKINIEDNLQSKSDYYTSKKKQFKKPQTKPIEFPEKHKYEELFIKKGHERQEYLDSFVKDSNYTDYYDFSVDDEELDFIKKQRIAVFPPKKFQHNNQGNFLHFYKVAYEKGLPVMFSTDSMLHSVNENTNRVVVSFLENVFIFALKKFFENLVHHCEQLKENPDLIKHKMPISSVQIYYAVAIRYLQDGLASPYEAPSDIQPYVLGVSALGKKYTTNNIGVLMKNRKINTASLRPTGFWKRSRKLANIWATLKFYNLIKLDLRSDLKAIYLLGKIIVESGNKSYYYQLREMIQYLIGEEHTTPDFVQVYELGKELFKDENNVIYYLDDDQIHNLNSLIVKKVNSKTEYVNDLRFLSDYLFYSQESFDRFRSDKEDTSFLFNKGQSLEDWVLNKLIEVKQEGPRLIASSFELIDAMHHAGTYRPLVFNRYKGQKTFGEREQFMKFRDAIDIQENFEKAKYSIKRSMENEPQNWRKNLQFHNHYLLYKLTRRIKHSQDSIYKGGIFKESSFYTAWGAYVHFKRQIQLMTVKLPALPPKVSDPSLMGIPEVVIEPHLEFYKELENYWNSFKGKINQFVNQGEYMMEINYKDIKAEINHSFDPMTHAIQFLIKAIKLQETGQMTNEFRNSLKNLIYYDEHMKWTGWYANLFDNMAHPEDIFNYDIWINNSGVFPAAKSFEFEGASLFNIMRMPNLGIITLEDQYEKTKKIMLFAKYNVKEVLLPITMEPNVEQMSQDVLDRD